MATTKTLTPTNQAITLAAFTEKPDNRTNVTNDDKLADAVNALNSKFTWRTESSSTFDSTKLTDAVGMRRGYTVLVRITFKAGLAATWHNDIVTGLSNIYTPPTAVFGIMRVNAGADVNKNAVAILNTNGTVQFLSGDIFQADVPFEFVFPSANDN